MRVRRWWLAGGLALALVTGGAVVHIPTGLAEGIQKPGHGPVAEMIQKPGHALVVEDIQKPGHGAVALGGYAIGGRSPMVTADGYGIGG